MLLTLSRSPWQCDMTALLRVLRPGDGVLAALNGSPFVELLLNAPITLHALKDDVDARGLAAQISSSAVSVSYTDFVSLAVKNAVQLNW